MVAFQLNCRRRRPPTLAAGEVEETRVDRTGADSLAFGLYELNVDRAGLAGSGAP